MKFTKHILKNGIRLITVPMVDNPSVTVLVMVEAGSNYESKEQHGISHFLEHMVFKGTTKRPKAGDISRELDSIGASYNAFTSQEYTGYYVKVDARHTDRALEVISDMYQDPLLDEVEIEKEKGVIIEEIRMYKDMPQSQVANEFMSLVYGDQPAGREITGTEATVRAFTRDAVFSYRKSHYVASGTIIVVAGAIDEAKTVTDIESLWSSLPVSSKSPKDAVVESQQKPAIRVIQKDIDQAHVVIGMRAYPVNDPRVPALTVLATILGGGMSSRLFIRMREELGVCYYVGSENDPSTDHGLFSIAAGVDTSRLGEALQEIIQQCKLLKTELVSEAELQKVKDYIAGTTLLGLETSGAQAQFYAYQETIKNKVESVDTIIDRIRAVTAEDVRAVACDVFRDERLNMALISRSVDQSHLGKILTFS